MQANSLFDSGTMLLLPDQALFIKISYMNDESPFVTALRKFHWTKERENGSFRILVYRSLSNASKEHIVLKDRPQIGKPSLSEGHVTTMQSVMQDVTAESFVRSSAEAVQILKVYESEIWHILQGILHL